MDEWMDLPTSYHFGFPLFTQLALDDEAPGSPATLCRIRVMENGQMDNITLNATANVHYAFISYGVYREGNLVFLLKQKKSQNDGLILV